VKLPLEEDGLYLANDEVVLINMELGIVRKFERSPEGFTFIPREYLGAPAVLVIKDGGIIKNYVVVGVDEKEIELEQVTKKQISRQIIEGHLIRTLGGEAPTEGEDKERAMSYLRAL